MELEVIYILCVHIHFDPSTECKEHVLCFPIRGSFFILRSDSDAFYVFSRVFHFFSDFRLAQ